MEDKKKGRRFVPSFIPLEKDVIKIVNTFDDDKHMRAVRKPGDDKVYLYVSPLFYIAIQDFTRGRYSKDTYAKKSSFTRFMDEKIPSKTRSHIKKYVQPKTQNIMGTEMHLVDLPYMTDKGSIYEMPFGKKRPEGEALSTSLFENKNTMKISELRTIIKEEINNRLSEDKIKNDFIEKLAIELIDTLNNWSYPMRDFDMEEAADVILNNADLPEGMNVDMRNSITTDDIISKATDIEFGMNEDLSDSGMPNNLEKELDNIAKKLKASVDSDDRLSITVLPPTKLDGKMYYGIEKDDPERFNQFKYGAYAVKEAWGPVSRILGISFDDFDKMDKIVSALRAKKLIDLEW